jgi:hypothetical protein
MSQLEALALTIAIELAVVAVFAFGLRFWPTPARSRAFLIAAAASLLSHPWAWWANTSALLALPFAERALVIEGVVVAFETILYALASALPWWRAALVAFVANATSFAIGLALS